MWRNLLLILALLQQPSATLTTAWQGDTLHVTWGAAEQVCVYKVSGATWTWQGQCGTHGVLVMSTAGDVGYVAELNSRIVLLGEDGGIRAETRVPARIRVWLPVIYN